MSSLRYHLAVRILRRDSAPYWGAVSVSETALISTVVIVQFSVLAGLVLYLAQRIERRIDRLEARFEARFEKIEAQLRALEIGQAKVVGRLFGDDRNEFELSASEADAPLSGAAAPAT